MSFDTTPVNGIPSFEEFAAKAKAEIAARPMGNYLTKLPPGDYAVQFLGVTMVTNPFGVGYIPEYKFNHDGVEKTLRSASNSLAASLGGRVGQTVILKKGLSPKTGKTFWDIK